jgi:SAM-dependent methyltransferase
VETSFRDPNGQLLKLRHQILRFVNADGKFALENFLNTTAAGELTGDGCLVKTKFLGETEISGIFNDFELDDEIFEKSSVVAHETINFPSFPYEWSPQMLYASGVLTLEIAEKILAEGWGLKDATPDNILFRGARPVFVDMLSFERRNPQDSTWLANAQFVRTHLLPLLVNKHLSIPLSQIFLTNRDGLTPENVYQMCSFTRQFAPSFLTLVSLPTWLGKLKNAPGIYQPQKDSGAEKAAFILKTRFKTLRRKLEKAKPRTAQKSVWSNYAAENMANDAAYVRQKMEIVSGVLSTHQPRRVLDVGSNTGEFSCIAAQKKAFVVSIDRDPAVIDRLWQTAHDKSLNILPLVVDISRPSPGIGWNNHENASFLDRANGFFDAVLMLAVIHHLLVTERVPLDKILQLAAELTTDLLIIEFVAPDDPMFRQIARGRDHLHRDLTNESFQRAAEKYFNILSRQQLSRQTRWLYVLQKKDQS